MFLADLISTAETAIKPWVPKGSFAKWDEKYYDIAILTPEERMQAYGELQSVPEGAILIIGDCGHGSPGIEVCKAADPLATGEGRAKGVLDDFKAKTAGRDPIDVFVIPGNATSPVGAAAFGKSVAEILKQPVAAIVTGAGSLDSLFETVSGGMLMAPTAKVLHALDAPLEFAARFNPFVRRLMAKDLQDVTKSVHETATILEILKDRLLETKNGGVALRAPADRHLKMIVGHSKGNWSILTALLNFEFNIANTLPWPGATEPKTHIVTLGNWVSLPDMNPIMSELFHYHQFVGTFDVPAALASTQGVAMLALKGRFARGNAAEHRRNPDELLFFGCGHNLIHTKKSHLPIEHILPDLLAA